MRAHQWIAQLRRETTSGDWLPELDGLRFIAILAVLLYHMQSQLSNRYGGGALLSLAWLTRMVANGNRGVPLFFVISGFILARPFAQHRLLNRPPPNLRRYLLRRLTRLEPPYVLNLVAVSIALLITSHQPFLTILPHLAASLGYIHYLVYGRPSTINAVAWSLEIEVQFYLLAPLLCAVFVIRSAFARRALILAAMVAAPLLQFAAGLSPLTLAGQLQYFLAGLLLADLFLTAMPRWQHRRIWDAISLVGWPLFLLDGPTASLWLPFLILLLCVAAMRGVAIYAALRTPWIAVIGGMGYTIYLWHAPVLTFVARTLTHSSIFVHANYPLMFALQSIAGSIAVATACLPLFIAVERPCMDRAWPQKLARRLRYLRSTPSPEPTVASYAIPKVSS